MDKLGHSIEIATVFFILSLISERFITWFKLYFFKKGNTLLWIFFNWEKDYSIKTDDPIFEKEREQRILLLNISLNIFIAFLIHANIFKLINDNPLNQLGWSEFDFESSSDGIGLLLSELFGCIFGGLLMSLGSKFWHDTLDMLFYLKNLKNKLGDKVTYEMNSLKEIDEWITTTEEDIIKKVFEENKTVLKNISDVISVGIGHKDDTKYIEVVTLNNNTTHLIPNYLPYYLPNNSVRKIPVKVIVSSPVSTFGEKLSSGEDLANSNEREKFGTLGIIVNRTNNDSKKLALTCYHVVINKHRNYDVFDYSKKNEIIHPHGENGEIIGKVEFGVRNNEIDAALIAIEDSIPSSNTYESKIIKSIREIKYEERYSNIKVKVNGFNKKDNSKKGIIRSLYNDVTINYLDSNGQITPWEFNNLIAISDENGQSITFRGDSGSVVLDEENRVVGMVVGGNKEITYAIPINTIFKQLNIKLS